MTTKTQGRRFQTFVVLFQQKYYYNRQSEETFMGYPLLTFNLHNNLTMRQIRDRIWQLTKPFVADENIDVNDNDKQLVMQAQWGFNNVAELTDNDQEFNSDERNMKFFIHFNDPQHTKNCSPDLHQNHLHQLIQELVNLPKFCHFAHLFLFVCFFSVFFPLGLHRNWYYPCTSCIWVLVLQNNLSKLYLFLILASLLLFFIFCFCCSTVDCCIS